MNYHNTPTARVFHYTGSEHLKGWYYQFEHQTPVGPFDTALEAGTEARKIMVTLAKPEGEA